MQWHQTANRASWRRSWVPLEMWDGSAYPIWRSRIRFTRKREKFSLRGQSTCPPAGARGREPTCTQNNCTHIKNEKLNNLARTEIFWEKSSRYFTWWCPDSLRRQIIGRIRVFELCRITHLHQRYRDLWQGWTSNQLRIFLRGKYPWGQYMCTLFSLAMPLNIKMSSYQYRDPHVKDKTVSRPCYL